MQAAFAEKKNYSLIGRLVYKLRPDIAHDIEAKFKPGQETDLNLIYRFYSRFTNIELTLSTVNKRRHFCAVMLKLYHPHVFTTKIPEVKYGFQRNIAACFSCGQDSIARDIREVAVLYSCYSDFEEKVNEILLIIKDQQDAA